MISIMFSDLEQFNGILPFLGLYKGPSPLIISVNLRHVSANCGPIEAEL
jgi:hypothetical protein